MHFDIRIFSLIYLFQYELDIESYGVKESKTHNEKSRGRHQTDLGLNPGSVSYQLCNLA